MLSIGIDRYLVLIRLEIPPNINKIRQWILSQVELIGKWNCDQTAIQIRRPLARWSIVCVLHAGSGLAPASPRNKILPSGSGGSQPDPESATHFRFGDFKWKITRKFILLNATTRKLLHKRVSKSVDAM